MANRTATQPEGKKMIELDPNYKLSYTPSARSYKGPDFSVTRLLSEMDISQIYRLLDAGNAHTLGNVQASKVTADVRDALMKERGIEKASAVTTEMVTKWREANKSVVDGWFKEYVEKENEGYKNAFIARERAAPTTRDPIAKAVLEGVVAEVKERLSGMPVPVTLPENDTDTVTWTLPDGSTEIWTRSKFIERGMKNFGDRIRAKILKEMAEAAEKAAQPENENPFA